MSQMDLTGDRTSPASSHSLVSFEQVVEILEEKIQNLLTFEDYRSANVSADLRYIQRQTRYSPDVVLNRRLAERIVRSGIAHVYLRAWHSLSTSDYLQDSIAFTNLQLIISIIWNCTDKSISLCDSLARAAVANHLLAELHNPDLVEVDLTTNADLHYLVKAYLGILHNMVRLCTDSRQVFRAAGAVSTLQRYLSRPQGLVRTKAYLILSYVVNEQENDIINANDENIGYIIQILRAALDSENHFAQTYAFWASEIACGLNHLAVNDGNKRRLGQLGAIELYVQLLRSGTADEQSLAAAGLWILSFSMANQRIMNDSTNCLQALQQAATNGTDEGVGRSARGALWVLRSTPADELPSASAQHANVPHIMISYHWGSQKTMVSVKDKLKAAGYKVWMDVDNMSGSTLEAMALAVEQSAVVLICLSQGYKDSPSCRTEAEYMYQLRKDIIPLVLEPGYVPDGWLGILVGSKLFFDLSLAASFDHEVDRLIREIGPRGYLQPLPPVTGNTDAAVVLSSHSGPKGTNNHLTIGHSYRQQQPKAAVTSWSRADVQAWLNSVQLTQYSERFAEFDGNMLLQFKKMMQTAPQYFYQCLEAQFGLKVTEILHFSQALDTLS